MSTPKEKASELVCFFMEMFGRHDKQICDKPNVEIARKHANECAMRCVEENINSTSISGIYDDYIVNSEKYGGFSNMAKYWQQVKEEINKL